MGALVASFIIPALNEAQNIGRTIDSIHHAANQLGWNHEVILVDHGSKDDTTAIARQRGAQVIDHPRGTIASLRNVGAAQAKSNVLVFLDADVTLTESWIAHIESTLLRLESGQKLISGSHCAPPESDNPLLKYWFASLAEDPRNTHLGTGHMIIAAASFRDIGGFAEHLRTGEDYEFCERAKSKGYQIHNDTTLKVIHHDFPTRLGPFIRREAWHGRGDLTSLDAVLRSKVALASLSFLAIHALLLAGVVFGLTTWLFGGLLLLAALLLLSSLIKNSHAGMKTVLYNAGIFYFYYVGRGLAIVRKLADLGQPAKALLKSS